MKIKFASYMIILSFMLSLPLSANTISPYSGEQHRNIKALSPSDIQSLEAGKGWGLAKSAELNGVPGPAHLLELKSQIHLSAEQVEAIQAVWNAMNRSAIEHGRRYLATETKIEQFFAETNNDEETLNILLKKAAEQLATLRYVHLKAHLQVKPLLTKQQILQYQALRGYSDKREHHQSHQH